MDEQRREEDYLESLRMSASMVTATHALKQKLRTFKQPMTSKGRQSLLRDVAEIRGYLDVIATLVVCAR
jgi:hypothetical protein